jgi:heme exporter protein D
MSMAEFFHMGGHGIYVWPAYCITLAVLLLNVVFARAKMRALKRDLLNQQRLQASSDPGGNPQ